MVKRSDRGLAKLLRSLGQAPLEPVGEMSSNLANDHQGQRRDVSCLHQQAGYKTASQTAKPEIRMTSLATREASI